MRASSPFTAGDLARWKRDPFGYYRDRVGIVINADMPIAKTDQIGYEYDGVIEVDFQNGWIGSSHWSNFEKVNP